MDEFEREDVFRLESPFEPKGDQPRAIEELTDGLRRGLRHQVLLGVTGSGKTFTVANVIAAVNRPTLVVAHNKILAAQLYGEFKALFPRNAVEYFVSYYDYYQPEAYVPSSDTYIEKDSSINDELDKLRLSATRSVLERRDVIVVASVSCIYGIGAPEAYFGMLVRAEVGETVPRDRFLAELVAIQYKRSDLDFHRGTFRVRGDTVEVFPAYESDRAIRVEFFGDEIDGISVVDPLRGATLERMRKLAIFPASHYVTPRNILKVASKEIAEELEARLAELERDRKLVEAQRLAQRTRYDLECLAEMGYCQGIENYSRFLSRRAPGQPPYTLIDYFPRDFLLVIDESHQTIPQLGAMYAGDRSRKRTLVDYGFRLPSALDNRPLNFEEFEARVVQAIYVSATPAEYELRKSGGVIVEQVVRPTGLVDPEIHVRPAGNQVEDLLHEVRERVARKDRVLITTLTKRMAEELTDYFAELGVRVRYMHSDVETLERVEIIRGLRAGDFDVLVGINLLREGLDLPEVSLVAILDADKEGFLRSERSLVQTIGRAARNVNGAVIMYADAMTESMTRAISETDRRRAVQRAYNEAHGITPDTVRKAIRGPIALGAEAKQAVEAARAAEREGVRDLQALRKRIAKVEAEMRAEAKQLRFERAAELRDELRRLRELELAFA